MTGKAPLVEVENVSVRFGEVHAVDGVSFTVERGEILGLVGESGSGKSTLGRTVVGLVRHPSGRIVFDGRSVHEGSRAAQRALRMRMQVIFQEAKASLSPRHRIGWLLQEPYAINKVPKAGRRTSEGLLAEVGLPAEIATKYPHQVSGGQARRVSVARAIALRPDFLFADEATAGLDASTAASLLNMLRDLVDENGLTILLVSHDLNVVGAIADRIAVMYLGRIVEMGPAEGVVGRPSHPYTRALLASVPVVDASEIGRVVAPLEGEPPSSIAPPPGCHFHPRCAHAIPRCSQTPPACDEVEPRHTVFCHRWREVRRICGQTIA